MLLMARKYARRERYGGRWRELGEDCLHTSSDKAKTAETSNPVIIHPPPAPVYSLCVYLSALWGLTHISLMTNGMVKEKHLLSA